MFRFHIGGKTALGVARYALAPSPALSNHTDRARKPSVGSTTVRFLVNCVAFWQYRLMARVTSKNSAPNGSALGFEATLWSVAEKLKGNTDAGEYMHIVPGHVSNVELVNHINAASTGTKMPRANWNDIARFEVCYEILSGLVIAPGETAAEHSDCKQVFLFDRLQTNLEDLNKALRDAMLPMPRSGGLRVPSVLEKMSTAN